MADFQDDANALPSHLRLAVPSVPWLALLASVSGPCTDGELNRLSSSAFATYKPSCCAGPWAGLATRCLALRQSYEIC
jgi:hypothetical protein